MTDSHDFDLLPEGPHGPEDLLSAYLFDELDGEARAALEAQLAEDAALAERLEQLRGTLALLRRSTLDAGPAELSEVRRAALRATASAASGGGGGGPVGLVGAEDPGTPRVLAFPWLRAAAALLIVTAGVTLYQQRDAWTVRGVAEDAEARFPAVEPTTLDALGSRDGSTASAPSGRADRLKQGEGSLILQLGYLDSDAAVPRTETATPNREAATRLGDQALDLGAALQDAEAFERLRAESRAVDNSLPNQELVRRAGDIQDKIASVSGEGAVARNERGLLAGLDGSATVDEVGLGGGAGGAFRGPGDSVPPGAGATGVPATPGTPSTPSTPVPPAESVVPFVPPAPGAATGAADNGLAPDVERDSRRALYFEEAGRWAGEPTADPADPEASGVDREALDLSARAGLIPELSFDSDGFFGATGQLGRDRALRDGYGRSYDGREILLHIRPERPDETPQDMFYRYYGDNAFVASAQDTMSTFAVDVDTASYPLARNYLNNGQLPPRAAVRTEEVVNYFGQGIQPPTEDVLGVQLDCAPTPFGSAPNNLLLRVGVKAIEVDREERLPMNLVFVVDKSGSMRKQDRLSLVRRSLELLLDQLRDDDRIGVVSFDTSGHVVQESVSGRDRWQAREALRTLEAGGSTNAAEGLFLGYEMLDRHYLEGGINRLVLASDGVANTGETDQQRILEQVADFRARQVDLTTIGVGMGNHNDVFLEQLADQGNGACHYVDGFEEAKRVFLDEFSGTMQTVARDVKIQVEFDSERVLRWRQIGYENRSLTHEQFRDDTVDAGEVGAGHEVVALYELELADDPEPSESVSLATVRLRWKPDPAFELSRTSLQQKAQPPVLQELPVVERAYRLDAAQVAASWERTPPRFRLAAVAAQYAEFLRRSYHVRGDSYDALEQAATRLARELDTDQQVRELRELIVRTRDLARYREPGGELWRLIEECRRITMLQQELRHSERHDGKTEALLAELLEQNARLEERIREHLDGSRD